MIFAFVGVAEIIPLLVFAALVAGIFSLLTIISNRNSKAAERLQRLSRPASLAALAREMARSQWLPAAEIEARQFRQLVAVATHAAAESPHFARRMSWRSSITPSTSRRVCSAADCLAVRVGRGSGSSPSGTASMNESERVPARPRAPAGMTAFST